MIDVRGFQCPIPVIMVQKEIQGNHPDSLEVLSDAQVAVENITRYAKNQKYSVSVTETNGEYTLHLMKE